MERTPLTTDEVLRIVTETAYRTHSQRLIDRVTVTSLYNELSALHPGNGRYRQKLRTAMRDLATAAQDYPELKLQLVQPLHLDEVCFSGNV